MELKLHQFEKLAHIKLFTFKNSIIDLNIPYDAKTIDRIVKDLKILLAEFSQSTSSFRIHAIYTQCYILVWSDIKMLEKDTLLF